MKKKVIVAGHACLDITPVFSHIKSVNNLSDMLSPGKLIQMDGVDIHTGGLVSNTGLAMKKLGAEVCLIAKIGKDSFGKIIESIYKEHGVKYELIIDENGATSYSVVLAIPRIDRIFLHDPGANNTFSFEDIQKKKVEDVVLFHFGYPPLMKKMYDNNGEELVGMMRYLKEQDITTSMDLAAVDADSEAGCIDWETILGRVLPYVDFFVPSIEEVCFMLDKPKYYEWVKRANGEDITKVLDIEVDIKPLADKCMKLGVKVLLLKCGSLGFYFKTQSMESLKEIGSRIELDYNDWVDKEGFETSYVPREVISATGAGDTTIAAFLAAMLKGYSFEMCIHLAAAAGACCVESYDAISGLKTLEELEQKIALGWEKRETKRC